MSIIQPDLVWYLKRQARCYARDLANRVQRVDVQALAAEWEVVGVDLSYWQGTVDFATLALKADFAIIRAGYGNDFVDPRLEEYRAGCKAHGIPFGLYWYAKAGKDFKKHALNFYTSWINDGGRLPPVFDLEETGGLAKSALESWWAKMYNAFNAMTGLAYHQEMTYTSPGFLNKAIALTNWLKWTAPWVAHWTTAPQPILPNEWAIPGFTWKFWQWSATGRGADYGVSSKYVDLNRYNGTRAQFTAEFGVPLPPPPPGDDEMKYRVLEPKLKIRSQPVTTENNVIGYRELNEIILPLETLGDTAYPGAYWVRDVRGWSAVQYYKPTRKLMQSFV